LRQIRWNTTTVRGDDGRVTSIVSLGEDTTDRKQAEAEKEHLEAMNRQLQKSRSLGRMAGAIAHHFNNQLQVVTTSLEMALAELPRAAGEPVKFLTNAMWATRRASEVSSLMLTYLGQALATRGVLDLSEACRLNLPMLVLLC
jgi:C4-dicarboxylate-specific signal transduction histidine kinase